MLLVHGTLDAATPLSEVERAERAVRGAGMQVARVALHRGAGMLRGEGELRSLMEFWAQVLLAPPPENADEVGFD